MKKVALPFFVVLIVISCNSQSIENSIILINIDTLNRSKIADEIAIVSSLGPKVVGVDIQFSNDTDVNSDTKLIQALDKCKNLVMASVIDKYTGENVDYNRFKLGSLPDYLTNAKTGFINSIHEPDIVETQKRFSLWEKVNTNNEFHFGVRVAMSFDSLKTLLFINKSPKIVEVDFLKGSRKFKTFSSSEVLNNKITRKDVEGKIVLIGFLGPGNEDKFFSPMNIKIAPYEPDMYGLEFHAYIISQVLD